MMFINLYSVKDSATTFMMPTYNQTDAQAIREFTDAVNHIRGENIISAHPEDFSLYRIAKFYPESGEVVPETVPVWLVDGSSVKER